MSAVPIPEDEPARLAAVHALQLLDTEPEERFDRITRLLRRLLDVPIAVVQFVDADRQWGKSCVGVETSEAPRTASFCAWAILGEAPLIVEDTTADRRFADNPLVTGPPHVHAYAGQPVHDPGGFRVGTLCAADTKPRRWADGDLRTLYALAGWVEVEIAAGVLRKRVLELEAAG